MTQVDAVKYLFVIDTDMYSGNFERPMCAYMTGQVGDCGVGDAEATIFEDEVPDADMFELVCSQADDHGCMRPATIRATPGWWNDGMGKHYRDGKGPKKKQRYPAYQSVGIWMLAKPTPEDIELLKKRAHAFLKYEPRGSEWRSTGGWPTKITGFRLLTITTVETSETL